MAVREVLATPRPVAATRKAMGPRAGARDPFAHPAWLLLIGAIVWICLWMNLGATSLETSDEVAHTEVAKNIIKRAPYVGWRAWTDLFYQEDWYYGKPPLKMWLTTLLLMALGQDEWVVRLPDVTFATVTTFFVWLLARRHWRGPCIVAAPIIFVCAPYPILEHGWREGVQESALTMLMTAAAVLFVSIDAVDNSRARRLILAVGSLLGLASLVKSVVPFLLYLPMLLFWLVRGRWRDAIRPVVMGAVLLSLTPWLVWHWNFMGAELIHNVGDRVNEWHGTEHPWSTYWVWLKEGFHPWGLGIIPAALLTLGSALLGRGQAIFDRFLIIWGSALFFPWMAAYAKHSWYVYPAYPAVALMLARLVLPPEIWAASLPSWLGGSRARVAQAIGIIAFLVIGSLSVLQAWTVNRHPEVVPLHKASDWMRTLPKAERKVAIGIDPRYVCPDERYYIDLMDAQCSYVPRPAEAIGIALRDRRQMLILTYDVGREVMRVLDEHDIPYRTLPFWPRTRAILGQRLPPRLIVVTGDPLPKDPFQDVPWLLMEDGFLKPEGDPEGPFNWIAGRATINLPHRACGTLAFRLFPYAAARTAVIHLPTGEVTLRAPTEGAEYHFAVDVPPGGCDVVIEPVEPCAVPKLSEHGSRDTRCLSLMVRMLRFEPDEPPHVRESAATTP